MYLQDLNLEEIDAQNLKQQVIDELESEPEPSEGEVEDELGKTWEKASVATAALFYKSIPSFTTMNEANFSVQLAGKNIWEKVRKFLCKVLSEGSTVSEIIDAVLEVLASIMPGGVVIKKIVKMIVRYFLKRGYNALCPVNS